MKVKVRLYRYYCTVPLVHKTVECKILRYQNVTDCVKIKSGKNIFSYTTYAETPRHLVLPCCLHLPFPSHSDVAQARIIPLLPYKLNAKYLRACSYITVEGKRKWKGPDKTLGSGPSFSVLRLAGEHVCICNGERSSEVPRGSCTRSGRTSQLEGRPFCLFLYESPLDFVHGEKHLTMKTPVGCHTDIFHYTLLTLLQLLFLLLVILFCVHCTR